MLVHSGIPRNTKMHAHETYEHRARSLHTKAVRMTCILTPFIQWFVLACDIPRADFARLPKQSTQEKVSVHAV